MSSNRSLVTFSRQSSITAESVDSYRDLIKTATDDLEAHLQGVDEKLEDMLQHTAAGSGPDATELQVMREERLSTQKCLQICAQLSQHIDQIQLTHERIDGSPGSMDPSGIPEKLTAQGLQECKISLAATASKLEKHMKDVLDNLMHKAKKATTSEDFADLARLRDEWDTARQCVDICSKAESHMKENVTKVDNYSYGDAVQFMVSNSDKTVHGSNRGLGWKSRQVGGHLSDASIQKLSGDFSNLRFEKSGDHNSPLQHDVSSVSNVRTEKSHSEFAGRHGPGVKLTPKTSPMTTAGASQSRPSSSSNG
jgi:hypothetical protein